MEDDMMCDIPLNATYRVIDGEPVMVAADWVDMSAYDIARFLIKQFGITAIYGGGDSE